MDATVVDREYISPLRKLMRFFHRSRDGWKRKCLDAKQANKLLKNQVRAVEHSREQWKQQVQEQRQRIAELEAELQKTAAC
jgi:chromosome segregation ATPase